tara:strand:+ start:96 stop:419 length:324 start_codon:yes stop_codon:yes gene_type:complete
MANNPNDFLNVEVYEKIADCEDWAMFTKTGNKKVQRIFQQTLQRNRGKHAEEYFLFASRAIEKLSNNKSFGEAMDSEVRRTLYNRIEHVLEKSDMLKFGESYDNYVW